MPIDRIITADRDVIIEYQYQSLIIYFNIISGQRWLIVGNCNYCGECLIGANSPDIRDYKERLDCPVLPEISEIEKCSLRGLYF